MLGEMWKNEPPFGFATNKTMSDDIAWHCKLLRWTWREVVHESGAALTLDMGVPFSKMEESIEARCQASLKTGQNQLEDRSQRVTAASHMTKPLARLAQGRNSATA